MLKSKRICSSPGRNRTYWINSSWNIKHHFCWNQNASSPAPFPNNCLPFIKCNSWSCFVLRHGEPGMFTKISHNGSNYYICENKPSPKDSQLQDEAIRKLKTLNVTDKDSLQNAVSIIQNLFDELKGIVKEGKVTVNVLVATKQLESFAFKYAMVHFTENQSGNFSEENYDLEACTTSKSSNANQLQNACKNMLKCKSNCTFPSKNRTYWTALSWNIKHHFSWNQNASSPAPFSKNCLPFIKCNSWPCFVLRHGEPRMVAKISYKGNNYYICEKKPSPKESQLQDEAIRKLKTLNVTDKDSLQNAVSIIQNLFDELKGIVKEGKVTVNVLVATKELESFAFKYAMAHFTENQSGNFSEENYEMKIQRLAANSTDSLVFYVNDTTQQSQKDCVGIELPSEALKGKNISIFIIYNNISQFVPKFPTLEFRNRIIAATVYPSPQGILQENVTISFNGRDKKEVDKPHCMFWNFTINSTVNGNWSEEGCSLKKSDDNKIICVCNHLTNFAVLMQVGENKVSQKHLIAMEIITYVGCGLSLTAEVLTVIAYCTLTDFKQDQAQIRLNLVVALAAAQIAFLSGIDALEPKGLCVFVAALIHYFYLVGFAWMFFEGVYLYLIVVKVFNTEIRLRAFYSVAWGCPAGIVVLSLVLAACQEGGLHSYIHGAFCWVSFSNNLIWAFVAPVLLVCLTNAVLLSLVIREILKMQSDRPSNVENLRQAAKACVVLSPLLGMTWAFGILSVTNAGLIFQYIFTILNSLQGFFIFLLYILRSADVRAEFKRKKRMWFEMRGRVADPNSSDKWTSKTLRNDVVELKDKLGVSSSHLSSRNENQVVPFQEPLPSVEYH
ncbi:adhesion G protein-coupled receptor L4-like [Acropora millepora]|uniref:adhesion G protein-coupled receptor L4-like n=1 Tax=Acropora millepora TaxID=45264 RepID=UPI001CF38EBF|nr:adhesion G protein-coupled receptor L4-like [Acropora millepora]